MKNNLIAQVYFIYLLLHCDYYYLYYMGLMRYIIWSVSLKDNLRIMDRITPQSDVILLISNSMLCVETRLNCESIRTLVGDHMEMACVELDDNLINKLLKTRFLESERNNLYKFLNMTKVPKTIDDALDLINMRGGVEYLRERELEALDKLTNNAI